MLNSADRTLEDALQYRLLYEAPEKLCGLYRSLTFHLQIYTFLSGAEGIRTPDLRRANAGNTCSRGFAECHTVHDIPIKKPLRCFGASGELTRTYLYWCSNWCSSTQRFASLSPDKR